jgi:hypothetical protein
MKFKELEASAFALHQKQGGEGQEALADNRPKRCMG